jgi:hypothetical protein
MTRSVSLPSTCPLAEVIMNNPLAIAVSALLLAGAAQAAKPAAKAPAAPKPITVTDPILAKAMSKANWKAFLDACKAAHMEENCQFLHSVTDYKGAPAKNKGALAEGIMGFYIGPGTKLEVNISSDQVTAVKTAYAAEKAKKSFTPGLFAVAEKEILKVMRDNINGSQGPAFQKVLSSLK